MLKRLLTACLIFCSFALMAQAPQMTSNLKFEQVPYPWKQKAYTGAEILPGASNPNVPINTRASMMEQTIGTTYYDLQSNSGIGRRLDIAPDGTIYAVWTRGEGGAQPAFPNRGTAVNTWDPTTEEWGDDPDDRIEGERCGWPNLGVLSDGNPINIAHTTDQNLLYVSRWDGTQWVQNTIPTGVAPGVIWPRLAIGGADGMSVHVLGLSYPSGNGGAAYEGVDGHVLYYRSTDGGVSWDITDMKLPELDSNFYASMAADTYYIDANGETIAVGFFDNFGDTKVFKSTDNGATWEVWNMIDFPLDKYAVDQGYSIDDIPVDPDAPDSLAIRTSDQTGTVLVDNDGKVHAWFGEMYVQDSDLADGNTSYFPATMGLRYWNEDMGENNSELIVPGIIDENGNDTIDVASTDNIALYFSSLTSHPSVGIDENGIIYLAYSMVSETYINEQATPNAQHNRHVVVMASTDGGDTWSDPWDVTNTELVVEPDLFELYETQFPAVAREVNDFMHILYQQDFEPGLAVRGDEDTFAENYMNYLALDPEEVLNGGPTSTTIVSAEALSFEISPNPASGIVRLSFDLVETAPTSITVYDMTGKEVKSYNRGELFAGSYFNTISVADLSSGLYLVRLQTGDQVATQKLQIQ